jgi:hypothetical protein
MKAGEGKCNQMKVAKKNKNPPKMDPTATGTTTYVNSYLRFLPCPPATSRPFARIAPRVDATLTLSLSRREREQPSAVVDWRWVVRHKQSRVFGEAADDSPSPLSAVGPAKADGGEGRGEVEPLVLVLHSAFHLRPCCGFRRWVLGGSLLSVCGHQKTRLGKPFQSGPIKDQSGIIKADQCKKSPIIGVKRRSARMLLTSIAKGLNQ